MTQTKKNANNTSIEERLHCFVPREEFKNACINAVNNGMFKRSFMFYIKGKTKKNDKRLAADAPASLSFYNAVVTAGGYTLTMRLDHVLTFLKLDGSKYDSSGEEVLGACIHYSKGRNVPEWRIVYYLDGEDKAKERNLGTVDHIVARANGGKDRLYNMQMMRSRVNHRKADKENSFENNDFSTDRKILRAAQLGLRNMNTPNKKSCCVKEELTELFAEELESIDSI